MLYFILHRNNQGWVIGISKIGYYDKSYNKSINSTHVESRFLGFVVEGDCQERVGAPGADFGREDSVLPTLKMGLSHIFLRLRALPRVSLRLLGTDVHNWPLRDIPDSAVPDPLGTARPRRGHAIEYAVHVGEYDDPTQQLGRPPRPAFPERVQPLEEPLRNRCCGLGLHLVLTLPHPRLLALSANILYLANRSSSSKTLHSHAQVRLQLRRLHPEERSIHLR